MKIVICGITGSIGSQSIEVISKTKHKIVGCTFGKNIEKIKKIKKLFPNIEIFSPKIKTLNTCDSLKLLLKKTNPDLVINAVVGFEGLETTLDILNVKKNICLANKESLVMAGWHINKIAKKNNVKIIPIDSEHTAILDIISNNNKKVKSIQLTASGGKFYNEANLNLSFVSFEDVCNHPKWNMGYKISIDSSTLMNKCFEIIEAYYLFNFSKIIPIYHPQAIVHSFVEFQDNSVFGQLSNPDMKLSIQIALSCFDKKIKNITYTNQLSFKNLKLDFDYIDQNFYKPIGWALDFLNSKNKALAVCLVCANDIAVEKFKNKEISFEKIILEIQKCIIKFGNFKIKSISDVFQLSEKIKQFMKE